MIFEWKKEQTNAFKLLQEKLTTTPVLKLPTRYDKFQITTDVSDQAIGALLEEDNNDTKPIAYLLQKLQGSQQVDQSEIKNYMQLL